MRPFRSASFLAILVALGGCDLFPPAPLLQPSARDLILRWNQIAVDASGLDHTPLKPGESRTFGHHLGPGKSSRAMAIVHIAMFECINAVEGGFRSSINQPPALTNTSKRAAIAQAAHDTLAGLFTSHVPTFDQKLAEDLAGIPDGPDEAQGITLGRQIAAATLALRTFDGAELPEDYSFSNAPGKWRVDPINPAQGMLGSQWSKVRPFVLDRPEQFRSPPPPSIDSAAFATAFNEVKQLGGDGAVTPTTRTPEQTQIGIYWAYDGTPSLCAPPRLYNQIAVQIANDRGINDIQLARLLALVNVAMADAGIAIWESKYFYNCCRPVTGIREADVGTGPTGLGYNNPFISGDTSFTPLGAPRSNGNGPNFTPPFPAYPSGHAGFGGALFEVLRQFFGTNDIAFTFVSDELNGVTADNQGNPRPLVARTFSSLSQAEEENGQSRIYLGIHWSFDKTEGITLGNRVGRYVFENIFRPVN